MSHPKPKISKRCEGCGVEVLVSKPAADRGRGRFCSLRCMGLGHGVAVLARLTCPRSANAGSFKLGEHKGCAHPRWKPPLTFVCEFCEQPFEVKPWVARQPTNKCRFCSVECRSRFRSVFESGPNSPDWKGGDTTYRGPNWIEARTAVIVDQKGRCADCGVYKGKSLPVHHIKPFREFDSYLEANARDNLMGLCQSCHMKRENPPLHNRRAKKPSRSDLAASVP